MIKHLANVNKHLVSSSFVEAKLEGNNILRKLLISKIRYLCHILAMAGFCVDFCIDMWFSIVEDLSPFLTTILAVIIYVDYDWYQNKYRYKYSVFRFRC